MCTGLLLPGANPIAVKILIIINKKVRVNFEVRHPRCVGSIGKNFCVLHNTVEHNYISPSSTVGIHVMVPTIEATRSPSPHPTPNTLKQHPTHSCIDAL